MKKKLMLILSILILNFENSNQALANCIPAYNTKINSFDKVIFPTRSALINSTGISIATNVTLAAFSATTTIALATSGAAISAVAIMYGVTAASKNRFVKVLKLINESKFADGKQLRKLVKKLKRKSKIKTDTEQLASLILTLNETQRLCGYNPNKGKIDVLSFRKLRKVLAIQYL